MSQWEIQEPWEVYDDCERWEATRELRYRNDERPEDEYPEPWERED